MKGRSCGVHADCKVTVWPNRERITVHFLTQHRSPLTSSSVLSYFMSIGDMDAAYRSVRSSAVGAAGSTLWANMAQMCVATRRPDGELARPLLAPHVGGG